MISKILKFGADWCMPCKALEPEFQKIKEKYANKNIDFESINIDKNQDLTEKYVIRSVPTVIILDSDNIILERIIGNKADKIEQLIEKHLN